MSIELKQAAQDAAEAIDWLLKNIRLDAPQLSGKAMGNAEKCASALRIALSQQPDNAACRSVQKRLAAQQPVTAIACGIPGMAKTTCPYCEQGFAFEYEQPTTTEPVEDGIRNAEDELSCAEEVLDAITCEFSDGEFPVTDFNCIGDYITAVVDVFKERLAAQQPATGEPVVIRNPFASRCYTMSESHLSGHRLIVGFEKLEDTQDAHEWVARQVRGDFTHPAPSVPGDVVRDAERYRWLRDHDHWPAPFSSSQEPEPVRGRDLDAAIDAAMAQSTEPDQHTSRPARVGALTTEPRRAWRIGERRCKTLTLTLKRGLACCKAMCWTELAWTSKTRTPFATTTTLAATFLT